MPTHTGKDAKGCFAQWGKSGKKYYYTCGNDTARKGAVKKANKQGAAIRAGGWTGNTEGEDDMQFERVKTNIRPVVRNDSMEGRDFRVVPTVMMVEGVHNGSVGPVYYSPEELGKLTAGMNHRPVVVYHPSINNGCGGSACTPTELTTRKVGVTMNVAFEDGKLKSEAWLEQDRMDAVDGRIGEAVENGEMMELSTGFFMNLVKEEGEWNGEKYGAVAQNLQLDHLALLPDEIGACSIEDGAGFIRANATGVQVEGVAMLVSNGTDVTDDYIRIERGLHYAKGEVEGETSAVWVNRKQGISAIVGASEKGGPVLLTYLFNKGKEWTAAKAKEWVEAHRAVSDVKRLAKLVQDEMSYDTTRMLLRSALQVAKPDAWIEDVYDDFFIYEEGGKLYKRGYTSEDGMVTLKDGAEEVVRITEYRTAGGAFIGNRNLVRRLVMDKAKIVASLISNEKTKWSEEHRDELMGMSESVLTLLQEAAEAETPASEPAGDAAPAADADAASAGDSTEDATPAAGDAGAAAVANAKPQTVEEYVKNAPPAVQEVLNASLDMMEEEKSALIEAIIANERNVFTEEDLKTRSLGELRAIAKLAGNEQEEAPRLRPNFRGQGDVGATKEEPLLLPNADAKAS
jgi:hypothetical protein